MGVIAFTLSDPLRPSVAVALGSGSRGLRAACAAEALPVLRQRHSEAAELCAKLQTSCTELRDAEELRWSGRESPLRLTDCIVLSTIIRSNGLPKLRLLSVNDNLFGEAGALHLLAGLGSKAMPSLRVLSFSYLKMGAAVAQALAAALGRGALPALETVYLSDNTLGDAGATALAPALRLRPRMRRLLLRNNGLGDEGLAALVSPSLCALKSLVSLSLGGDRQRYGDRGCAALTAAIRDGMLPALKELNMEQCDASDGALEALYTALQDLQSGRGEHPPHLRSLLWYDAYYYPVPDGQCYCDVVVKVSLKKCEVCGASSDV